MTGKMYTTTLRVYGERDIKLVKNLKSEFSKPCLSKCILEAIREYHAMKKELEEIHKAITVKYEIPAHVARRHS